MYFSGKITNSILNHLSQSGADIDGIYEYTELSDEFLRDPSCWLEADKVESFLRHVERVYKDQFPGESLVEKAGHSSHESRSWGVLNSVLKMMLHPQDLYSQPQRFISYFVSPAPPVGDFSKATNSVKFKLPISRDEYPYVTEYLRATFEALPCFMGRPMATVTWEQNEIEISWEVFQKQLFEAEADLTHLNPELLQSLIATVETTQNSLEEKEKELQSKDARIRKLELQLLQGHPMMRSEEGLGREEVVGELQSLINTPMSNVHNQLLRMSDYLTRAQQLVTLLVGQNRMDRQVKEAMKRMDWEHIRHRFTHVVQEGVDNIEGIKRQLELYKTHDHIESSEEAKRSMNLDSIVERAIAKVSSSVHDKDIQISRMLFFDRSVEICPGSIEDLVGSLLTHSTQNLQRKGKIRVVTRPRGSFAEIEISDNANKVSEEELRKIRTDEKINNIIQSHQGQIKVFNDRESGSTYLIDLPL